jgi:catechol 2,3-dioxygenase-like lactoylglutathione lyase family enzyme
MSESILAKNAKGTYGTMYFVRDMKKAVDWYKNVLGLHPSMESEGWTEIPIQNHSICLHPYDASKKDLAAGYVIINVSNIKNVAAELKKQGVRIDEIKEVCPGNYSVNLYDPDGNVVSLYQEQAM